MKTYLLVFNDSQITRKNVTSRIDRLPQVVNWIAFLDNTLCLVSNENPTELAALLRALFPDIQFLLTEMEDGKRNGLLPRSVWDFMNDPKPAELERERA